jgi:hypothetical protein
MRLFSGWSGVIDSGGELIEIGDLAQRIVQLINPSATIQRQSQQTNAISTYASDNETWVTACNIVNVIPDSLENQIRQTASWLLNQPK